MDYSRIQSGLVRSVLIAPLEAVSTVGLSVVLIGILAREGGLALVGQWALLQTYVSIAMAVDLGVTYGVNRRVATESPVAGYALVARAGVWPLGLLAFSLATALGAEGWGGGDWLFGAAIGLAAGAVQLLTQWCGAIQTGAHRHAYTQAASVFLSFAQFALVLVLLAGSETPAMEMLAAAILLARLLHLALTLALLALGPLGLRAWLAAPRRAPWSEVKSAVSGFTLFSLALKWRIPVIRLSIGYLGGDAALGVFTIAQRAPEAISAVFSSGLQTLLAGFAGLEKPDEAARLVRRGLEVQVALCLPLLFAFLAHTPAILTLWIGSADHYLVLMTRLMGLTGVVSAVTVPFFWALQAAGAGNFMARVLVVQTALVVAVGALGFGLIDMGVLVFIAAFALLSAICDFIYIGRAVSRIFGAATILEWIRTRRAWLVVALNASAAWASALGAADAGILELFARIAAYGAVSLAISWAAFR